MSFPALPYLSLPGFSSSGTTPTPTPTGSDVFEHSIAEIVGQMLVDLGHAAENGDWKIGVNFEQDVDRAVSVYDTAGMGQGSSMVDGQVFEHPGFQVRIKAPKHSGDGWTRADAIAKSLDALDQRGVTVDDATYLVYSLNRTSRVLAPGKASPASRHSFFTVNFTAAVRPAEA